MWAKVIWYITWWEIPSWISFFEWQFVIMTFSLWFLYSAVWSLRNLNIVVNLVVEEPDYWNDLERQGQISSVAWPRVLDKNQRARLRRSSFWKMLSCAHLYRICLSSACRVGFWQEDWCILAGTTLWVWPTQHSKAASSMPHVSLWHAIFFH